MNIGPRSSSVREDRALTLRRLLFVMKFWRNWQRKDCFPYPLNSTLKSRQKWWSTFVSPKNSKTGLWSAVSPNGSISQFYQVSHIALNHIRIFTLLIFIRPCRSPIQEKHIPVYTWPTCGAKGTALRLELVIAWSAVEFPCPRFQEMGFHTCRWGAAGRAFFARGMVRPFRE